MSLYSGEFYLSKPFRVNQATPSFNLLWDSNQVVQLDDGVTQTGSYRPFRPSDFGSTTINLSGGISIGNVAVTGGSINIAGVAQVAVTNTAPIPMSGVVQVGNTVNANITNGVLPISGNVSITNGSFDTSAIVNAQVSGNNNTLIADILLSGISGRLAAGVISIVTGSQSFDSSAIVAAQVTGNNYLAFISGRELANSLFLSSISGYLANTQTVTVVGGVSGNHLGSLDVSHTFLTTSGIGTANVNITNTAPIAVSGTFTATTDNSTVVAAVASGNSLLTIANALNSGISGLLSANLTDVAAVSGVVQVGNITPIWITGLVQTTATFTGTFTPVNTDVVNAIATGNNYLAFISGREQVTTLLLSGISGQNATGVAIRTVGSLDLTHSYLITSGIGTVSTSITNPIGITGTENDVNLVYVGNPNSPFNFVSVGGRATNPSGAGAVTGYNTGDNVILNFCAQNGGLFVNQANLQKDQDEVTTWIASSGALPTMYSVSGLVSPFFGTCLPSNPTRHSWTIQNIGTGQLMVKMSSSIPTTGTLDIILKGASAAWAGDGAVWTDSPATYTGPVSVSGFGGAPCIYKAWEV